MNLSVFIGLRYTGTRRRSQLVSFISRICIIGLVVSIALLIVILSVMNGFDKEFRQRMLSVIPQVTVQHRNGIEDWQRLHELMIKVPSVIDSAPFIEVGGMMFVDRRNVQQVLLYGVDPDIETNVSGFESFLQGESLAALKGVDERSIF
jgi:lipoprotein-releasing system permease protein